MKNSCIDLTDIPEYSCNGLWDRGGLYNKSASPRNTVRGCYLIGLHIDHIQEIDGIYGDTTGDTLMKKIVDWLASRQYGSSLHRLDNHSLYLLLRETAADAVECIRDDIHTRFNDAWVVSTPRQILTCFCTVSITVKNLSQSRWSVERLEPHSLAHRGMGPATRCSSTAVGRPDTWRIGELFVTTPALHALAERYNHIFSTPGDAASQYDSALELTGMHTGVDRAFLILFGCNERDTTYHTWGRKKIPVRLQYTDVSKLFVLASSIFDTQALIAVSDIARLQPELYDILYGLGCNSALMLPLWNRDMLAGIVGLGDTQYRHWRADAVIALRSLCRAITDGQAGASACSGPLSVHGKCLSDTSKWCMNKKIKEILANANVQKETVSIALMQIVDPHMLCGECLCGEVLLYHVYHTMLRLVRSEDMIGIYCANTLLILLKNCNRQATNIRMKENIAGAFAIYGQGTRFRLGIAENTEVCYDTTDDMVQRLLQISMQRLKWI